MSSVGYPSVVVDVSEYEKKVNVRVYACFS